MRCAIRTPHERPRPRAWVGTLAAVALLGGLLAPLPAAEGTEWAVPGPGASHSDPSRGDAVAGVSIVRSGERPSGGVALDEPLHWQSAETTAVGPLPDEYVDDAMEAIGAVGAWDSGHRGSGALVAVIDTGVDPVGALEGAVAGEIDFTGEGGGDGYGHGTFMASLIAGRGDQAPGVANEAGVLSLKVADSEGNTDLRTVLAALQWLQGPGRGLGVRVASLAMGVDPDTPEGAILDAATAQLTASGVLLVTASGNDPEEQALASPATSPGSLSVGATDGDEVAAFSAAGSDRNGVAQPDVLAPGVGVLGHAPPGSVISEKAAAEGADADRLADGHLRGSGTSVSAALGAGVAALASAANPELDGPELAAALGDGSEGLRLDAGAAIEAAETARTSRPAPEYLPNGKPRPVHPRTSAAELPLPPVAQWAGAEWNGTAWTTGGWAADRWEAVSWTASQPRGSRWRDAEWTADDWDAASWDGTSWVSEGWPEFHRQLSRLGVVKWNGDEWTLTTGEGTPWQLVVRWNVVKWNVVKWNVVEWSTAGWSADAWNVVKWNGARGPKTARGVVKWNGGAWNVVKWNGARGPKTSRGVVKWNGDAWNVVKWNGGRGPQTSRGVVKWNSDAWNLADASGGRSVHARPDVVKWNREPTSPARQ